MHFQSDDQQKPAMQRLIDAFVDLYPEYEHGPCHIVLSDYNLSTNNIEFCLGELFGGDAPWADKTRQWALLALLLSIPEGKRTEWKEAEDIEDGCSVSAGWRSTKDFCDEVDRRKALIEEIIAKYDVKMGGVPTCEYHGIVLPVVKEDDSRTLYFFCPECDEHEVWWDNDSPAYDLLVKRLEAKE